MRSGTAPAKCDQRCSAGCTTTADRMHGTRPSSLACFVAHLYLVALHSVHIIGAGMNVETACSHHSFQATGSRIWDRISVIEKMRGGRQHVPQHVSSTLNRTTSFFSKMPP